MSSNGPRQKRLRLGTRSCAECRRRKVKCVFDAQSRTCRECLAHDSPCEAQQPSTTRHSELEKLRVPHANWNSEPTSQVNQRLVDLEGLVQRLCQAIERSHDGLDPSSSREPRTLSSPEIPAADISNSRAPLLDLLKEAMIQLDHSEANSNDTHLENSTEYQRIASTIARLNSYIPNSHTLVSILEATEKFWFIWPFSPIEGQRPRAAVAAAEQFIIESMNSTRPAVVARAILWLSLCVQQLQGNFDHRRANLPAPLKTLLRIYMSGADALLCFDAQIGGTIEGVEALMLQNKIYVNMGGPQKAWLSIRQALNFSLLLGLHREAGINGKNLWPSIWHMDRYMSSFLGVAYAIHESHPSLSPKSWSTQYNPAQAAHTLSLIAGHIIDRNEKRNQKNSRQFVDDEFTMTANIQFELEKCWKELPPAWRDSIPASNLSLQDLYYRETFKMHYFQCAKLLHLPYMLKNPDLDSKLHGSRIAAVSASRDLIHSYNNLRNGSGSVIIMCDLMDFLAFSAGIVLIIHLLSANSAYGVLGPEDESEEDKKDWALVLELTKNLSLVAKVLSCSVADQGAQLLDHLTQAKKGTYQGPTLYEAVVPYFGSIKINGHVQKWTQPSLGSTPSSVVTGGSQISPIDATEIEFSGNFSMPYIHEGMPDHLSELELGSDWTSLFNAELDAQYDWSQVFNKVVG
jgi:hypothetical protein